MPLIIAVVAGLLLLVWGGVEVDHVVTAYPAESIFAVSAMAVVASATAVARYRAAQRRISINPATRGNVVTAAPVRREIAAPAAPWTPPAAPVLPVTVTFRPPPGPDVCDGPGCEIRLDDDPWQCGGEMPDGHAVSGRFHSKACMQRWQVVMADRHRA